MISFSFLAKSILIWLNIGVILAIFWLNKTVILAIIWLNTGVILYILLILLRKISLKEPKTVDPLTLPIALESSQDLYPKITL